MIYGGMITIAGGGGGGGSLGSGVSGILSLNSETGPHINIISTDSTIDVSVTTNTIDLSCSGFVSGVQVTIENIINASGDLLQSTINSSGQLLLQEIYNASGIQSINGEDGPNIIHQSADGTVDITVPSSNTIDHSVSGFVSGVQVTLYNDLGSRIETSGQILLQEIYDTEVSGIQTINGESGPAITLDSADASIAIVTSANNIDFSCSGYVASGFVERIDFDWNGFFSRNDSTIDFDHSTRTFTITPTSTSYQYYVEGVKYTRSGDSVVIPSGTEGLNIVYYDDSTLTNVTNPSFTQVDQIIRQKAIVSAIYWSTTQQSGIYVGEERHGLSMSPVSHSYHHFNDGLRYTPPGLALNSIVPDQDGSLDIHAQFGVDAGGVSDEDLYIAISAVGSTVGLPIYYFTGSTPNWNKWYNPGFSIRTFDGTSTTRPAWNEFTGGSWQISEVGNNRFVLYHVFATTEKDQPLISIMGQNTYANVVAARDGALTEIYSLITNDLLIPETRPIGTVIVKAKSSSGNAVNGFIVTTADGDSYVDWRNETVSRAVVSTSDHNALANLQGGTAGQYYHLTQPEYAGLTTKYVAFFTNIVSGTFTHGLGTPLVNYNIFASGTTIDAIVPDEFRIEDVNRASILFNQPQTGFMVITG